MSNRDTTSAGRATPAGPVRHRVRQMLRDLTEQQVADLGGISRTSIHGIATGHTTIHCTRDVYDGVERAWTVWRQRPHEPTVAKELAVWRARATCVGMDPDLWFNEFTWAAATRVCFGCPVQTECLNDALTDPPAVDHGVRGGVSRVGRSRIRSGESTCSDELDAAQRRLVAS